MSLLELRSLEVRPSSWDSKLCGEGPTLASHCWDLREGIRPEAGGSGGAEKENCKLQPTRDEGTS